eukprot:4771187-Prymnesium_polylepis.1
MNQDGPGGRFGEEHVGRLTLSPSLVEAQQHRRHHPSVREHRESDELTGRRAFVFKHERNEAGPDAQQLEAWQQEGMPA